MESINSRLKELRLENGYTQVALADAMGLRGNSIILMEKDGGTVKDSNVKLICLIFNVNENWLRNGVGEKYKTFDENSSGEFLEYYSRLSKPVKRFVKKVIEEAVTMQNESVENK